MHIDSQQAVLAVLASFIGIIALAGVSLYLLRELRIAQKSVRNWRAALQAVGAELYLFDHVLAKPQALVAQTTELVEIMQNTDLVKEPLQQLLETGYEFETTARLGDKQMRIKGGIEGGRAFVLALEMLHNAHDSFEALDDLPVLAYILNESDELIYANRPYKAAMNGEMRAIFTPKQLELGHAIVTLGGARLGLSLHKIELDKRHNLVAAFDISQQRELEAQIIDAEESYHQVLELLPSGIALFNRQQKLVFFNQSFVQLFGFEINFLESKPSHSKILEYLRDHNQLPMIENWQSWQEELLSCYHSLDMQHYRWNLPNGKKIQITAQPQGLGGTCWILENLTSQLELQARYDGLIRRQGETLDNLLEGVALFGEDGRIILSNPAFTKLWGLDLRYGMQGQHINDLEPVYAKALTKEAVYSLPRLVSGLAAMPLNRILRKGQLDLKNGDVLEYSICPLPLGQSMLRFVDVTAKMRVARALADRNDVLLKLDKIRSDFVHYLGYELRTPLTSIIGFTQLIKLKGVNGLALDQQQYLDDVEFEAGRLQVTLDDTIDLVNLNDGVIKLANEALDIALICNAAAAQAEQRLAANSLSCDFELPQLSHNFYGDSKRITQLLTSILRYISLYAPSGEQIKIKIMANDSLCSFNFYTSAALPFNAEDSAAFSRIDLSLARSLLELLKGKISFKQAANHSVITVQVPLKKHG